MAIIRLANCAKIRRFRTCGRSYLYDTLLERVAQYLQHVAAARRQRIPKAHAMVGPRPLARHGHLPTTDQPHVRDGVVRGAKWAGSDEGGTVAGEAVNTVDAVVSRASARVMSGRMVVSRRANLDFPAPGAPSSRTLWSERLHHVQRHQRLWRC
jgi:hypothetical protein